MFFSFQGHHINSSVLEQRMVAELRDICRRYSTDDFSVTVFQPFFIYIDQVFYLTNFITHEG